MASSAVAKSTSSTSSALAPPSGLPQPSLATRLRTVWQGDVDPASGRAIVMLVYFCFLTGFTSAVTFSACFIWCGFQTGGVAQLGLAVARNFAPRATRTYEFEKPDQQALTSLLSFLLGTALGRIGDRIGCKRRSWLVGSSVLQAVGLAVAAVLAHYSGEPSVAMCDLRALSVFALFLGAVVGRALVDVLGSGKTFAVGVGLRCVQALGWLFVGGPAGGKPLG